MTPLAQPAPRRGMPVVVSIAVALGLLCIGSGVVFGVATKMIREEREGWNLVPVIVAAVDVGDGEVLNLEKLSQRSIPEQFVTNTSVKPNDASYVVDQRVRAKMEAGDLLRWGDLAVTADRKVLAFARVDLAVGATVGDEQITLVPVDDVMVGSWVASIDLEQLRGRKATVATRAGEPLLWTHFAPRGDAR